MKLKILVLTTALAVSALAQTSPVVTPAPTPPAKPALVLTPLQKAQLESGLKDLVISQLQYAQAQTTMNQLNDKFNQQQAAVEALAAQVKKENKWGDDVVLNQQTGGFDYVPAKVTPAKDAPKPK